MLKKPHIFLLLLLVIIISTTAGCFATMGKKQKLDDTLRTYEGAIRWNEFEMANSFGANQKTSPDLSKLQNIRVTAYQVKNSIASEDELKARQTVVVQYYDASTMRQETAVHNQQWRYDEEQKRWLVEPSLPDF
jgi:hypothetical protein